MCSLDACRVSYVLCVCVCILCDILDFGMKFDTENMVADMRQILLVLTLIRSKATLNIFKLIPLYCFSAQCLLFIFSISRVLSFIVAKYFLKSFFLSFQHSSCTKTLSKCNQFWARNTIIVRIKIQNAKWYNRIASWISESRWIVNML